MVHNDVQAIAKCGIVRPNKISKQRIPMGLHNGSQIDDVLGYGHSPFAQKKNAPYPSLTQITIQKFFTLI